MIYKLLKIGDSLQENVEELFDTVPGVSSVSLGNNGSRSLPSKVLVCTNIDEVVAAVEVYTITATKFRIINLAVKNDFRYKGIATQLLAKIELEILPKQKEVFIRLIPTPNSYGFYLKNGYTPDFNHECDWLKKVNS